MILDAELDLVCLLRKNIKQAIKDYRAHTTERKVLDDVSDVFVDKLAEDAAGAKYDLREMLRKSPVWNEDLQAVIINGTRTHNPDYRRVHDLAEIILAPCLDGRSYEENQVLFDAIRFFSIPNAEPQAMERYINAVKQIAPKAYRANRKKSRIFKNICDVLGITNERAGSGFQKLFAQFADELNGRQIDFKLFLSINPAHFLTMSNPKFDRRGNTLTSCHSFNDTHYSYNCGCSGYARDKVTMIAFTVDNPNDAETLNNRKTTRQLFMYQVGNGLLLQSRMYNSSGGVYGASELSPLYRDLIQREISELEGVPNLWKPYSYCKSRPENSEIEEGEGFGGYADWMHEEFDAKLCVRADHKDGYKPFTVGTYGLCIRCGEEISQGLYCDNCVDMPKCDCCGGHFHEDDMYAAYDSDGGEILICDSCRDNFGYCSHCDGLYSEDSLTRVDDDTYICPHCLREHYEECEECGGFHLSENMFFVANEYGDEIRVCGDCLDEHYIYCDDCDRNVHEDLMVTVTDCDGTTRMICESCCEDKHYEKCDECGEYFHKDLMEDGLCPECRTKSETELA